MNTRYRAAFMDKDKSTRSKLSETNEKYLAHSFRSIFSYEANHFVALKSMKLTKETIIFNMMAEIFAWIDPKKKPPLCGNR